MIYDRLTDQSVRLNHLNIDEPRGAIARYIKDCADFGVEIADVYRLNTLAPHWHKC